MRTAISRACCPRRPSCGSAARWSSTATACARSRRPPGPARASPSTACRSRWPWAALPPRVCAKRWRV